MSEIVEVKVIESFERRKNSSIGNPQYRVNFTDGTSCFTKENSGWAYECPNSDNIGVPMECHFTPRARYLKYARRIEA